MSEDYSSKVKITPFFILKVIGLIIIFPILFLEDFINERRQSTKAKTSSGAVIRAKDIAETKKRRETEKPL